MKDGRTLAASREEAPAVLEELAGHFEEVFGLVHGRRLVFRGGTVELSIVVRVVAVVWLIDCLSRESMGTAVGAEDRESDSVLAGR